MEKSRTAVCDDRPMHALRKSLTRGHVWSVPGERTTSFTPNVHEHRDYTNLYKLMAVGGLHLRNSI